MLEWMHYGFMVRAVISSLLVGLVCSVVGVFVVTRGLSFIGAGIAHAAFAGVTLGFLIGFSPLTLAVLFSLATVWLIQLVERRGRLRLDVSIGIFFSLTMALAILFIGLMRSYNAEVYSYLFGNLLGATRLDLIMILVVSAVVLTLLALFFKEYEFILFDCEVAEAAGIPTGMLSLLLLTMIAVTVVVSLKAVGVILVFALIITPAASAYQLTHSLRRMVALSAVFGTAASLGGLFLSYAFDLPSGATIVLTISLIFGLCTAFSPKRRQCEEMRLEHTEKERKQK
ncbi:MAG: metal ABC transporter permease [Candidatus Latescibacterota bacterium]